MADDSFKQVITHATQLRADHGQRDQNNLNYEDMFMLRWKGAAGFEEKAKGVLATISQVPRVKVLGAERMIKTTDAEFRMRKEDQPSEGANLDKLEKMANVLWKQSSRLRGQPLHFDIVRSAILYDEICIGVNCTADILAGMKEKLNKKGSRKVELQYKRMEEVAKVVPYTFEVYHPNTCYPVWDAYGLKSMLRVYTVTVQELLEQFGVEPLQKSGINVDNPYVPVEIGEWNDLQEKRMWVWGKDFPLMEKDDIDLPFLPFIDEVVEGGMLSDAPHDRRQGFLFTIMNSNIWFNDCLAKSILYKNVFEFGGTTKQVFTPPQDNPDATPRADFDADIPNVTIPAGSQMRELEFMAVPPELQQAITLAGQDMESATVYSTAFGQSLGAQAAYSTTALLNMVARQALNSVVEKCNWAIADAGKIALKWMKYNKKKTKGKYGSTFVELSPKEIPDDFELECNLELDLAQDKLQMSQMALNLNQAGLNDRAWIREEIQGIEDSDAVEERVVMERTIDMLVQQDIQDALMKLKQKQAMAQMPQGQPQPGAASGQPQEAPPPQMGEAEMQGGPQPIPPMPVAGRNMVGY